MADLESFDNKKLHDMCLEYGLPNVPVTKTSRNVIIKRLAAAMADDKKEKAKARRETFHALNSTNPVDMPSRNDAVSNVKSKLDNVRRTIAQINQLPEHNEVLESAPVATRRRSGRQTPNQQETDRIVHVPQTEVIEEDDENGIIIVEDTDYRKSRSPSLGKSVTVKTNYRSEYAPKTIQEEPVTYQRSAVELNEPIIRREPSISMTAPISRSSTRYSPQKVTNIPITRLDSGPTVERNTTSNTTSSTRFKETRYSTSTLPSSRYTGSSFSTSRPFSLSSHSNDYNFGSAATRRTVHEENMEDYSDDAEPIEAPYFSQFAKRLSEQRAHDITSGANPKYRGRTGISTNYDDNQSVVDSFKQFFVAIDRKYQLKQFLFLFAFIFVFIFIYIFFLQ